VQTPIAGPDLSYRSAIRGRTLHWHAGCFLDDVSVSFALVHHANQYLITDGYDNREGISDIVGSEAQDTGILSVLAVHEAEGVPLNLHISGTLLEAMAWHCPKAVHKLRHYIQNGLIELLGSSYGQNIMRFFSPEYNRQQLNEELYLYQSLLGVQARDVKVFWPPERVWDTRRMAPALRDAGLLNEGYRYVIVDDRTLVSPRDPSLPRSVYDQGKHWTPDAYQAHEIESGLGLVALPIAVKLRRSIPPKLEADWQCIQAELDALLVQPGNDDTGLLALYADDLEKVIGVWGTDGPQRYAEFLRWITNCTWIRPVQLTEWASSVMPSSRRTIEIGTFEELAREFNAGEGYENWFYSDHWAPYREYFQLAERRVRECKGANADGALIELAEKQLLLANWETAWHTPSTGAHGNPIDNGKPSPWARALTSHSRHALVTAEAACWMKTRDGRAHAAICDIDLDNEPDLVLKNDALFAFISKRWGGRVVALFHVGGNRGAMVVGNPSDDWNFLEELNRFMETPRNHPGAFADVGFENDRYSCDILERADSVVARLLNVEKDSAARGLKKEYVLAAAGGLLTVRYRLPQTLKNISIECGLSPDYLALLRYGSEIVTPAKTFTGRGFSANGISVVLESAPGMRWEQPEQEWIGHGRTLRLHGTAREFELRLRVDMRDAAEEVA
jgi:hypothetical protein